MRWRSASMAARRGKTQPLTFCWGGNVWNRRGCYSCFVVQSGRTLMHHVFRLACITAVFALSSVASATESINAQQSLHRSEQRSVGKECVRTCRSRCEQYHQKQKTTWKHVKNQSILK